MREHGHLRDPRQARKVRGPQVQVLQVHGGRHRKGVRHVDLLRHPHAMLLLHDVLMLQLHLVLPIQSAEATMQPLRIDVVHVERPCRGRVSAGGLPCAPPPGGLLLQLLLHAGEGVGGHVAGALTSGHRAQNRMVALGEDPLATRHGGRHGEPELRGDGAGLEEALGRIQVDLNGHGHMLQGDRWRERAIVAHGGHGEGAVVASHSRPAPASQGLGRGVCVEVLWNDNVEVTIGNV
mmetsp:Transcript_86703/g.269534  ORF Transcript_86703/g.269534 Transcript_86703/m.269534 type:complete len:236 (+) Transcript_86703:768-1475(+)